MQDAGRLQAAEVFQVQAQRAGLETELLGDPHQTVERRALEGNRKTASKLRQVGAMAVVVGDHRQGRQTAFGGLGLQDGFHAGWGMANMRSLHFCSSRPAMWRWIPR